MTGPSLDLEMVDCTGCQLRLIRTVHFRGGDHMKPNMLSVSKPHQVFSFHRSPYSLFGVSGLAVWKIQLTGHNVLFVWNLPYVGRRDGFLALGLFLGDATDFLSLYRRVERQQHETFFRKFSLLEEPFGMKSVYENSKFALHAHFTGSTDMKVSLRLTRKHPERTLQVFHMARIKLVLYRPDSELCLPDANGFCWALAADFYVGEHEDELDLEAEADALMWSEKYWDLKEKSKRLDRSIWFCRPGLLNREGGDDYGYSMVMDASEKTTVGKVLQRIGTNLSNRVFYLGDASFDEADLKFAATSVPINHLVLCNHAEINSKMWIEQLCEFLGLWHSNRHFFDMSSKILAQLDLSQWDRSTKLRALSLAQVAL